ncbi:MAG: diacylglycerol kinase [Gammaproteobacteria bacterium]|nr:diacylglycerol kinase [Gammaproteobacteria bacterium]
MAKTGATGITRIINAAGYSWLGFKAAYKHEAAFRQELWLCILLIPAALYFGETLLDKAILISSLLFVLVVELINSAIEAVVDRFGDELHELSGRAKDMGSTAVFIAITITIIIWISVLSNP